MNSRRTYRVKEVSRLTGVSVRALHHYDEIGLLHPSTRSGAGYRLYTDVDLLRLQQILLARELGLSLEEIRRSFEDPSFDEQQFLLRHREGLARRAEGTARMIQAVDRALAQLAQVGSPKEPTLKGEADMDMKDIFDGFDPARYERETEERWGHTDVYQETMLRVARYTPEDWRRYKGEQDAIYAAAFELLQRGDDPTSTAAKNVAEQHRLLIDQWFYPCSPTVHASLSDLYESDPRFAQNIDRHRPGLTPFLVAAIRAKGR